MLRHWRATASCAGVMRSRLRGYGCPLGGVLLPLQWDLFVGGLLLEVEGSQACIHSYADHIVMLFQGSDMSELHTEASCCLVTVFVGNVT